MTDHIEADLREMFARHAAEVPSEARARLREIDYRPRRPWPGAALVTSRLSLSADRTQDARVPRRLILRAACAGGAIAAAGATAAIVFAGGETPNAFAGWSAEPTAAASGQVQAAESECRGNSALTSLAPTVVDTRGPYTLLVYVKAAGDGLCVTGPSLRSPSGLPPFAPFRDGGVSPSAPIASDAIRRTDTGSVLTKTSPIAEFDFNAGRVGANVTAVTLVLEDGSRIQATVSNGWFAVDWPGDQQAQMAEITTRSGATVQQRMPTSEPGAQH
jgi:hypothetical protein